MENGSRIFYLRDFSNCPKGAVGINSSVLSFAMCSKRENFSKPKARMIVAGRLQTDKALSVNDAENFNLRTALKEKGLLEVAKKQKVDFDKAEMILKKILDRETSDE